MKICYVYADSNGEWNCSQYIAIDPMNAINKTGIHSATSMHINEFIANSPESQKKISEADIVLVERNLFHDTLTMIQFYKTRGQNFLSAFDDAYSFMHPKNVSYSFWAKNEMKYKDAEGNEQTGILNPTPLTQLGWGISMCKGLQVVSQALVDDWAHCNDGYIINHHIVVDKYLGEIEPMFPHDGIWIGWSGSMSHVDSFQSSGLLRALTKVVNRHKGVKVLMTGDKRVFDLVDVPPDKKMYCPYVPAESYPSLLRSLDIFTIPLAGEYDKRRSQIKPVEAMALKIPFLATRFPNYAHLEEYGNFTDNDWHNWTDRLSEMIENLPKYKEKAVEVGFPFAMTQDIDLHVQERIDLYQKMIDKPYRFSYPPEQVELERSKIKTLTQVE